jgi:hypothetical protein
MSDTSLDAVLRDLAGHLGVPDSTHLITERRGTQVWQLGYSGASYALKISIGDAAQRLPAREAAVLTELDRLRVTDHLVAHGNTPGGSWVTTRWFTGATTWSRCASWRKNPTDDAGAEAVEASRQLTAAVAQLHGVGWTHGDLQGRHGIHAETAPVRLIDFALARGPAAISPDVPYRGGLVHLTAPEIHQQVLDTPPEVDIEQTPEADTYTLAATLLRCWTRQWPTDYAAAGVDPQTAELAHLRRTIIAEPPRRLNTLPAPQAQTALAAALDHNPANRPTAPELRNHI